MVSGCLPSDVLSQRLPSYWGFSYLGCGISLHVGYMVALCLPFGVTDTVFPAAAPSYIPTINVQWFQFLHSLTSTDYFPFFFFFFIRPGGPSGRESACNVGGLVDPWVGKIPWRRERLPTPVFLPGESQGQRSLAGYRPWGLKELDTTEQLTFSLSPVGVRQCLAGIWTCISLLTVVVSIFDLLLGCGCIFFGRKCRFTSFAHFLTEPFVFLLLSYKNSWYILDPQPLSGLWLAAIFSHL